MGDKAAEAVVKGTQNYHAVLGRNGKEISLSCDCPYMEDGSDFCKHLWAVVLACSEKGLWKEFDNLEADFGSDDWEAEGGEETGELEGVAYKTAARDSRAISRGWKEWLGMPGLSSAAAGPSCVGEESVFYLVTPQLRGGILLYLMQKRRKKDGEWTAPKALRFDGGLGPAFATGEDRRLLALLASFNRVSSYGSFGMYNPPAVSQFFLGGEAARLALAAACTTERCLFSPEPGFQDSCLLLRWDADMPWNLRLELVRDEKAGRFRVGVALQREGQRLGLLEILPLGGTGLFVADGRLGRVEERHESWIASLRQASPFAVPKREVDDFLGQYYSRPDAPELSLPQGMEPTWRQATPRPWLLLKALPGQLGSGVLEASLTFDYEGARVEARNPCAQFYQAGPRVLWQRDRDFEGRCLARLAELGFKESRPTWPNPGLGWLLSLPKMSAAVGELVSEGWHVEAQGKLYRGNASLAARLESGVDWFDLKLSARFDGLAAPVKELLAALKKGERTVRLDDGSFGMMPEEWLVRYGLASRLGNQREGSVRFAENQVGLLDALLAAQPEISCDPIFDRARQKLRTFQGLKSADAPAGFEGVLRPYQREGLGWLAFLREFGFGGCLADDMGLGKTVQVLALLQSRDGVSRAGNPSLVVVPKSLIFNWKQEAAKFAPKLRVMDHTGLQRPKNGKAFQDFDLVLTTYGTLRRDILWLRGMEFDYVILDEAHAVKNPGTESAKAARLLKARHRLALTGTPVQNSLNDLWSLFEFLNPGMLGSSSSLELAASVSRESDEAASALLTRAVKPFLLRRSKEAVARDLPAKTEQVIYCEMEGQQRSIYEGLRRHYLESVMGKVNRQGLARSKMQVLEALLRLRQAACHPGLVDRSKEKEPGAKLEVVIPQLQEVLSEGHKALVFSQFTSFLSLFRRHWDPLGMEYAYLDGRTRDRQQAVEKFQNDPDCGLFLISLKAGGLGLNLTAAEYVYLLDPWWNPAIEAQAVDRTHRIGQDRPVFAYRLICRDTVEEKILELQERKKNIAKAALGQEEGVLKSLTREELQWLLS